ncbi:MAG TPA: hypothetical protein VFT43_06700 [Candidatus Polarisedimenticolia bacterium]|nr:hypothetical protein [Candidatus Polarisedimenticolia bacterium]
MSDQLNDLLDSIDRALTLLKAGHEKRAAADVANLLRIKRILEGLDPDEIDALLEDENE